VTAATACEVYTARAFRALFEHRGVPADLVEPLAKLIPDTTFQEDGTRETWATLTGRKMNKKDAGKAWTDYANTVVPKRNAIVHNADSATPEEAAEVLRAAHAFIDHLSAVMRANNIARSVLDRYEINP
jgi:hypothetical protein